MSASQCFVKRSRIKFLLPVEYELAMKFLPSRFFYAVLFFITVLYTITANFFCGGLNDVMVFTDKLPHQKLGMSFLFNIFWIDLSDLPFKNK